MFKVGDTVVVLPDAPLNLIDHEERLLGRVFKVLRVYTQNSTNKWNVLLDYGGGWWVNSEALELTNSLQRICAKVAFMNKRFEER